MGDFPEKRKDQAENPATDVQEVNVEPVEIKVDDIPAAIEPDKEAAYTPDTPEVVSAPEPVVLQPDIQEETPATELPKQEPSKQVPPICETQVQQPFKPESDFSQASANYGYQSPVQPPVIPKNNGMAIASMVLGIVGIPLICCCWYLAIIPAILSVIFGFMARTKIRDSFGAQKGNGMAVAGIILGFVTALLFILLIFVLFGLGYYKIYQDYINDILNQNMYNF